MSGVDLRLAPAAVLAWTAAWIATGGAPATALAAGSGWLAALAGGGMIVLAGLRAPRRAGHAAGGGAVSVVAHVTLAAACVFGVVATAAERTASAAVIEDLAGRGFTAELRGTVISEPEPVPWGRGGAEPVRLMLDVREVDARGATTASRARVVVTWVPQAQPLEGDAAVPDPRFGAEVVVSGVLRPAEPGRPESALLNAGVLTVQRPPPAPLRLLDRHRDALMAVTRDLAPQARGLVPGAAIGDTTRLPDDIAEAMKTAGLTHVTAVSGGHFAIVITLLTGVAGTLGAPRWVRVLLLAAAGTAFVALVRPEPSVLRAAVMAAFGLAGVLLGRPAQSLPALAGTVIGLLVVDPWLSRSFAFALSAAATAGLVLLVPPLVAHIAPWTGKTFAFALAVPLAAQAACGPVLVVLAPQVSLVAVPANLLAAPALVPATVLGLAATVLAPWWAWGAHLLAQVAGGATWWIAQVAEYAAALPGGVVPWPGGLLGAVLLAGATAAALALLLARDPRGWPETWRHRAACAYRRVRRAAVAGGAGAGRREAPARAPGSRRRAASGGSPLAARHPVRATPRWPAALMIVTAALGLVVLGVRHGPARGVPRDWVVAVCDVGQGDGLAVRTGPAAAMVVDVGPDGDAAGRCLDRLGVTRVDLLVLSHFHADHVGGLAAVLDGREVRSALVSPLLAPEAGATRTMEDLAAAGVPVRRPVAGERGTAGEATWDVLLAGVPGAMPGSGTSGASSGTVVNDASVTLLVRVSGLDVVLLGDLEDAGQAALLAEARSRGVADVDVVKVAHHGSRVQSPALAERLSPAVALVSVGRDNDYGHPTDAALDLYSRTGAVVLRTDECGTFGLVVRQGSLAVGGC
ncbi:ComEC/Rec2 family competence protein [Myceligenerans indicum]|uniref:DUF4131 domain-containing protein n=1 Tax=Myceligenerans indicum TaxID=2593663 RepID=A0ABS1LPD5_9MICO|nr:ComEC/Rec2 family competence protein [Myceligenerans indicum]MBL0887874.1 DUF4131 domain-containing protein [Myceligenerans indicum]